jgi:hypothetical protein
MGGRTSGSGESWEAGVGFVVVKARVVHCESGLGALRQACRSGVAIIADVVNRIGGMAVFEHAHPPSKSRDWSVLMSGDGLQVPGRLGGL